MKKLLSGLFVAGLVFFSLSAPAFAQDTTVDVFDQCEQGVEVESAICNSGGQDGDNLVSMSQILINSLLIALGMVAVVMIVVGGFRYVLSRGEAGEVKVAKDIILYSAVGLIVAILAYTIVNFVLGWF